MTELQYMSKEKYNTIYSILACLEKGMKTAPTISGNCPFLGPVNFFRDASHSLITALCFCHSRKLLLTTPKTAAAALHFLPTLRVEQSHLNFVVYDSLLDFWHPSSTTVVHNILEQAPPML
jgi:hypothetical protein